MDDIQKKFINTLFNEACLKIKDNKYAPSFIIVKNNICTLIKINNIDISTLLHITLEEAENMAADYIVFLGEQDLIECDNEKLEKLILNKSIPIDDIPGKMKYLTAVFIDKNYNSKSLIGKIEKDLVCSRFIKDEFWVDYSILNKPLLYQKEEKWI